jgi:hypothetical protein
LRPLRVEGYRGLVFATFSDSALTAQNDEKRLVLHRNPDTPLGELRKLLPFGLLGLDTDNDWFSLERRLAGG